MRTSTRLALVNVSLALVVLPAAARAARCSDDEDPNVTATRAARTRAAQEAREDECIPRDIYFMPGVFGVVFQPSAGLGTFTGAGVQIAPFLYSHNNDRFGPSQGSLILSAALLRSPRTSGTMALFEVGATASFERNSSRRWLIPYFGGTIGGLTQSDVGTSAFAYPLGGVHLYWHQNLMFDAEGGYHFPFQDVDHARGPRAQLSARFSLW
jgi:hypothetical protein